MTHAEFANNLRELATFIESHPELPVAGDYAQAEAFPDCSIQNPELLALIRSQLGDGHYVIPLGENAPNLLKVGKAFGPIKLNYFLRMSHVLPKRTVTVEESYIPEVSQ